MLVVWCWQGRTGVLGANTMPRSRPDCTGINLVLLSERLATNCFLSQGTDVWTDLRFC
jgi:hypothetical protein